MVLESGAMGTPLFGHGEDRRTGGSDGAAGASSWRIVAWYLAADSRQKSR